VIGNADWWGRPGRATQAAVAATLLAVVVALGLIAAGAQASLAEREPAP